jgi:hypothetical protein
MDLVRALSLSLLAAACSPTPPLPSTPASPTPPAQVTAPPTAAARPIELREAPTIAPVVSTSAADLVLAPASPGAWSGAHGNAPASITGIWGTGGVVFAVGSGTILRSTDRGLHWAASPGPLDWPAVWGSSVDDVYVGGKEVVHSTDRGATWTPTAPLPGSAYAIWGSGPDEVFAVGGGDAPFIVQSRDHGKSWQALTSGVRTGWFYDVLGAGKGEVLVAGKKDGANHTSAELLSSTDGGKHWTSLPVARPKMTDNEEIRNLCFSASGTLYASMSYAVYATRDRGRTWKLAADVGTEVIGLGCFGREILIGGRNRRFRRSADDGQTWSEADLDGVWGADRALISLQAMFVAETGEAYVGGEAYNLAGHGTLLRRAP